MRLSVYIGEFHPDAHTNGTSGWSFIALIFNNFCATRLSNFFIFFFVNKFASAKVVDCRAIFKIKEVKSLWQFFLRIIQNCYICIGERADCLFQIKP